MDVTRRQVGSLCLASAVGLSGCTGSLSLDVEFVDERPSYIQEITLTPTKVVVRFNQLEMSDQLQNVALVSESYGQLDAGVISSGISEVNFNLPNDIGDPYTPSAGDTLYLLLLEGGEVSCLGYACQHDGGTIIDKFELQITEE